MTTNLVQIEKDSELKQRLEAERTRLRKIAGLDPPKHFHRPVERVHGRAAPAYHNSFRRLHMEA